ncbi:MAG: ErfK/YbiS/YcfS/YnhG family protein [Chloroflexi bacterium]|nr:ErfK/YbiS/YcfS/YnhG family protein [Chloroflexota bacterium]
MTRVTRWCFFVAIVLGVFLPVRQVSATSAPAGHGLHVVVSLIQPHAAEGGQAGVFVHTGAFAKLTLVIRYAANLISSYNGIADPQGRFVFSWHIPKGMHVGGAATLRVTAQRGDLSGAWSGSLGIQAAPLPPLFVQPLQPSFLAGTTVSVFVSTEPSADLTYRLVTDDGTVIASGKGTSDPQGRYVISAPATLLPKSTVGVNATVSVTNQDGTRVRSTHFQLRPRPPLGLFVSTTHKVIRAGDSESVFISTKPGSNLTVTLAVTSTVALTATGVADKYGRWVYTARLYAPLTHPHTTKVTVQATNGIDQTSADTTFILQPGPPGLVPGGDNLATPQNPSPDLHTFFTVIPDKVIMVTTEGQVLRAYDHGLLAHETYVTTGRPELPTIHGIFHVYLKQTPFEFHSPWPLGSPFYYAPTWIRYWMPFSGGYGLHDSPWRAVYGPGTNLPHYSSDPGEPVGSHGCVNIPLREMAWLWNWADVGTTVVVY